MALITQAQAHPYLTAKNYETSDTKGLLTLRGPALVALAYDCGVRESEIIRLKGKHWRIGGEDRIEIDPDEGPAGTQRPLTFHRIVPVAAHVVTLAEAYLSQLPSPPGPEDYLIRSVKGGDIGRSELTGQMRNPSRGRDDVEARTLPSFAAAFATAMAGEENERLVAYVTGGRPPDGSP